jgi:hypothetical protein
LVIIIITIIIIISVPRLPRPLRTPPPPPAAPGITGTSCPLANSAPNIVTTRIITGITHIAPTTGA